LRFGKEQPTQRHQWPRELVPQQKILSTNCAGLGGFPFKSSTGLFRLAALNIATKAPQAFNNLVPSYGILHTSAGNGEADYNNPQGRDDRPTASR
jgi:hypothetical protein